MVNNRKQAELEWTPVIKAKHLKYPFLRSLQEQGKIQLPYFGTLKYENNQNTLMKRFCGKDKQIIFGIILAQSAQILGQ